MATRKPAGNTNNGVGQKFLCFLPHKWKKLDGSVIDVDASAMNLPFMTPTAIDRDPFLQVTLDFTIPANDPLRRLRFVLVDLTGDKLNNPAFAGHRELEQGGLGSMAKLACMFSAFQLKFDLEQLAAREHLTSATTLFQRARDIWNAAQVPDPAHITPIFPSNPKIELSGKLVQINGLTAEVPRPASSPDLERMFTVTPTASGVSLAFTGADRILVDTTTPGSPPDTNSRVENYVNHGGGITQLRDAHADFSFAERMFLMIDNSDDPGTQTCVENVSFLYIASSLWQSDIYRPQRGGGLWQGTTQFDGPGRLGWLKFDPRNPRRIPFSLPPVPQRADAISANAASIAALLTLMAQGRLVNQEASASMKHLMGKQKTGLTNNRGRAVGSYTRSFFREGLRFQQEDVDRPGIHLTRRFVDFPPTVVESKIGIADFTNDCVFVVRPDRGKELRYVAAGFDDSNAQLLRRLIVRLDMCIQENNGLTQWNGVGAPPP